VSAFEQRGQQTIPDFGLCRRGYCDDKQPATTVIVTVNGWIEECCPRCAVRLVDPIGAPVVA
jgi:hypothetical protein